MIILEVIMKQTEKIQISLVTKYLMILLMIIDLIVMAALPFELKTMLKMFYEPDSAQQMLSYYYVLLYVCGILVLLILNNLRFLLNSMITDQPFVRSTEKRLMQIGIESFLIGAILIIKIFLQNSMMTMTSAGVFILAGLFCFVLSDLFHRAVDYKEENDLTI